MLKAQPIFAYVMGLICAPGLHLLKKFCFLFQQELEDLRRLGQRAPHLAIGASLASAGLMFGAAATSNQENHPDIWTTANLSSKYSATQALVWLYQPFLLQMIVEQVTTFLPLIHHWLPFWVKTNTGEFLA